VAASLTVSAIVSGTPCATVADEPKLERMSLRTMPESSSTFTPFEPSPGYGPPVSSGTSVTGADAAAVAEAEAVGVAVGDAVGEGDAAASGVCTPHAASRDVRVSPPKMPSARRRSMRVWTS
jgi:hypothetical protein